MKRSWIFVVLTTVLILGVSVAALPAASAKIANGKNVKFDYTLKIDGHVVETTADHEPLEYVHGEGQIIPGLAVALEGLEVGDQKTVVIPPQEAYGDINPDSFQEVPISTLPEDLDPAEGMVLELNDPEQGTLFGIVWEVREDTVVLNFNHPLAGKTLEFDVKVVEVEDVD